MNLTLELLVVDFLKDNVDVFPWKQVDLQDINPK